tara:strand:+ start:380 stop:775 length:396 start_codon:yes stop_codon:yes gene_type:complete
MAVVTLLSDFVDGTSMALSEDTEAETLNAYMTAAAGRLWAGIQQRRLARHLTRERRGPGTLYFASTAEAHAKVMAYLQSDTGSSEESNKLKAIQAAGVEIAPHIGKASERDVLIRGQQSDLTAQARAKGFG